VDVKVVMKVMMRGCRLIIVKMIFGFGERWRGLKYGRL
jgi:hypothetical protein